MFCFVLPFSDALFYFILFSIPKQLPWEAKVYMQFGYYDPEPGEFPTPPNPKYLDPRDRI